MRPKEKQVAPGGVQHKVWTGRLLQDPEDARRVILTVVDKSDGEIIQLGGDLEPVEAALERADRVRTLWQSILIELGYHNPKVAQG